MLYLKRPDNQCLRRWLREQSREAVSYREIGDTARLSMPKHYHHIDFSMSLGRGPAAFSEATEALGQWGCFNLPWTRLVFDGKPDVGNHLVIAARIYGCWSAHCCRVVDCDPGLTNPNRWSFTVGTLPQHMAQGEEKISVRLDRESGDVIYRIRSFSRPNWRIARWLRPFVRTQQDRFCRDSAATMLRFIRASDRAPTTVAASTCMRNQFSRS